MGSQSAKEAKSNETVSKNLTFVLASLARKGSHNFMVARKVILIEVVAKNTITGQSFVVYDCKNVKTIKKKFMEA